MGSLFLIRPLLVYFNFTEEKLKNAAYLDCLSGMLPQPRPIKWRIDLTKFTKGIRGKIRKTSNWRIYLSHGSRGLMLTAVVLF